VNKYEELIQKVKEDLTKVNEKKKEAKELYY